MSDWRRQSASTADSMANLDDGKYVSEVAMFFTGSLTMALHCNSFGSSSLSSVYFFHFFFSTFSPDVLEPLFYTGSSFIFRVYTQQLDETTYFFFSLYIKQFQCCMLIKSTDALGCAEVIALLFSVIPWNCDMLFLGGWWHSSCLVA